MKSPIPFFSPTYIYEVVGPMDHVGGDEEQPQGEARRGAAQEPSGTGQQHVEGRGGALAGTQSDADDEDESSMDTSEVQHERELEERMLHDDVSDEEPERRPEPVDDTRQSEYVNSLTLPRREQPPSPNGGAGSTGASTPTEEPGNCRRIPCRVPSTSAGRCTWM